MSRITKLKNCTQREYFVGDCSILITPSLDNCHSFDIYDENIDPQSINKDFKKILNKYVDWNSKIISFGMIPENQLSLVQEYWNKNRTDQYKITYHCYTFRLDKDNLNQNIKDISCDDIYIKPLNDYYVDDVLYLNNYLKSYGDYITPFFLIVVKDEEEKDDTIINGIFDITESEIEAINKMINIEDRQKEQESKEMDIGQILQ